jgi:hypothetical protein
MSSLSDAFFNDFDDGDDDEPSGRGRISRGSSIGRRAAYSKSTTWFRFDLKNFDQVPEALEGLVKDLEDMRPFFRKHFVPAYLLDMQLQFETEGRVGTPGGWELLDPDYERWKDAHYPGRLILERTRKLRRSFSPGGRSRYLSVVYGNRSARIETTVEYAFWVNLRRKILIPPNKLNNNKYKTLLEGYLGALIGKRFGNRRSATKGSSNFLT